jgi:hypothetical protein
MLDRLADTLKTIEKPLAGEAKEKADKQPPAAKDKNA